MNRLAISLLLFCAVGFLGTVLSACGESENRVVVTASEASFVPVIESSDIFVDAPRLVLTLRERDGQPEFGEGATFLIRYFEPTEGGIKFHSEAQLDETHVENLRYLIADDPPFHIAGQWAIAITVELSNGTAESTPRLPFLVRGEPSGLSAGDPAPTVDTPTESDGVLERMVDVSDDRLDMYQRSASELLARGEPFLIVWASADRCAGRRACARALDQASEVLRRDGIAVLHIEPFGRPRQDALQALIDTANEAWSIEVEPQWFVVDAEGVIAARFEIVVESSELETAIGAVTR